MWKDCGPPTPYINPPSRTHSAAFTFLEDGGLAAPSAKQSGGFLGGLFGGGGGGPSGRAVPFDPADMRALDGLAGSLKTTGVLNK